MHHAIRGNASGFYIYNDPAIAIAWLLEQAAARVAYIDIDVHHGDGAQAAFWNDPRADDQPASTFGYPVPRHGQTN
jgi:acetoin utilization protein AcuC